MRLTVYQEQQKLELSVCIGNALWEKYLRYLYGELPILANNPNIKRITVEEGMSLGEAIREATEQDPTIPRQNSPWTKAELETAVTWLYKMVEQFAKDKGNTVFVRPLPPPLLDLLEDLYPDRPQLNNLHLQVCWIMTAAGNMHRSVRLEYKVEPLKRLAHRTRRGKKIEAPVEELIDDEVEDGSEAVA